MAFRYFSVEVGDSPADPARISGLVGYYVTVCSVSLPPGYQDQGTVPISWAPWSLKPFPGDTSPAKVRTGGYSPALPETSLRVGQCASGWLSFREPVGQIDGVNLVYRNSLGEHAEWNFH